MSARPRGHGPSTECHPRLASVLAPLARRRKHIRRSLALAACWALTGLVGLALMALENLVGWSSWLALPVAGLIGFALTGILILRFARQRPDWRALALQIEAGHPDLEGRLLTAVQESDGTEALGYLRQRVLDEAVAHHARTDWGAMLPFSRLALARAVQFGALAFAAVVLWGLRLPGTHKLLVPRSELGVTITPGDAEMERGSSLVVLAEFKGRVPGKVDLVMTQPSDTVSRMALVRSLADPLFGVTIPEVATNFVYHLEYSGQRTRNFKVAVFEYPRLERADAEITFPEYTGEKSKRIDNTRRVSAVEGSRLALTLHLNKPVERARLIPKEASQPALSLQTGSNAPVAALNQWLLERSAKYDLQLVDFEGRTNKAPAQFFFDALKNLPPEVKLALPRGDVRPSALEEIAFEGTVWDDFGVRAYGLAYASPGKEAKVVELGQNVPAKDRQPFRYLLRLEDLGMQANDLVSWFVWADDIGPDGKVRRTTGDLFFAEIRPFEEVFRQGQSMSGGQEQQQRQGERQGGPAERLGELQKQIVNATWNLFRRTGANFQPAEGSGSRTNRDRGTGLPPLPTQRSSGVNGASPLVGERMGMHDQQDSLAKSLSSSSSFSDSRGRRATESLAVARVTFGQLDPVSPQRSGRNTGRGRASAETSATRASLPDDLGVITDAQAQAIDQARAAQERQQDPRNAALWGAAIQQMQRALDRLQAATNSPGDFQEALAAEQAAYQALLKLQEREYSVSRSRNRQGNQGGRQQQLQRQLEQLDLTREENRYETERQAQAPQTQERREQLQVMNRLQELARRQQDVNDRLKELQTALQEARTEKEREEIRRRLKRLQEEEQRLLADADEVRQRMERPENQARMSDQRRQLEQTRENLRRAAEATEQGQPSQALAAGTRAQRELEHMREDLRRQSASEFEDDLKRMRAEARDLARRQEEVQKELEALNDPNRRTLSDTDLNRQALEELAQQAERLTNLVQNATQLSQQAEAAEPLMSRELYDALRKFTQHDNATLKQFQEELMRELMTRGMTSRELYQRVKRIGEQSDSKALDLTSEMLRQGFLSDAAITEQQARAGINDLKRGVERAAESVLGDDAESLRLAAQELDRLADQLRKEIAQGEGGPTNAVKGGERPEGRRASAGTNQLAQSGQGRVANRERNDPQGRQPQSTGVAGTETDQNVEASQQGSREGATQVSTQSRDQAQSGRSSDAQNSEASPDSQESQSARNSGSRTATSEPGRAQPGDGEAQTGSGMPGNQDRPSNTSGPRSASRQPRSGGNDGTRVAEAFDRLFDGRGGGFSGGPITGEDFAPWSDSLRNVEELVDTPSLRTDVARARERARQMRQDYKRDQKKPDWAVVRLQVLTPLVEVRDSIAEELARREPRETLVPIDRDPVPERYSELVRRYYEELGKASGSGENAQKTPASQNLRSPAPVP